MLGIVSVLLGGCATRSPEIPYTVNVVKQKWNEGLGQWRDAHPEYKGYIIRAGFGGPSSTQQGAEEQAQQRAFADFSGLYGATLQRRQVTLLDYKTEQVVRGGAYYWYCIAYVGFDPASDSVRPELGRRLVDLESSLPKLSRERSVLTAVGWPSLVAGVASVALGVVSFVEGTRAYSSYGSASLTSSAGQYRSEAQLWSVLLTIGAAGSAGIPLGSAMLLLRPNVGQAQRWISNINALLNGLSP